MRLKTDVLKFVHKYSTSHLCHFCDFIIHALIKDSKKAPVSRLMPSLILKLVLIFLR